MEVLEICLSIIQSWMIRGNGCSLQVILTSNLLLVLARLEVAVLSVDQLYSSNYGHLFSLLLSRAYFICLGPVINQRNRC